MIEQYWLSPIFGVGGADHSIPHISQRSDEAAGLDRHWHGLYDRDDAGHSPFQDLADAVEGPYRIERAVFGFGGRAWL